MTGMHIHRTFDLTVLEGGLVAGFGLMALFWLAAERVAALYGKRFDQLIQTALATVSPVLCMAAVWAYLRLATPESWYAASMALACLAFCAYGIGLRSKSAFWSGVAAALVMTVFHIDATFRDTVLDNGLTAGFVLMALFWVAMERVSAWQREKFVKQLQMALAWVTPVLCMVVVFCYLRLQIDPAWLVASVALACFAFCAYGIGLRSASPVATGVAMALIMTALHMKNAFHATALDQGMVAGSVLLALFWVAIERVWTWYAAKSGNRIQKILAEAQIKATATQLALVPVILVTLVLIVMAYRVPHLMQANRGFVTIGWFAVAAGEFVLSLAFRQRQFRYAGLAVIAMSLVRLFLVDMSEQDPLLRVAAFAVVGAGLLAISVGYYKWLARVKAAAKKQPEESQGTQGT